MEPYIPVIVAFLGGGLITAITNFQIGKKKNDLDGFKILEESWIKKFNDLQKDIDKANENEIECLERYADLDHKYDLLRAAFQVHKKSSPELPIPMWIKDMNGIMVALNDAYEKTFLLPINKTREDYIGNDDEVIWGELIAKEFKKNDRKVVEDKVETRVFENVKTAQGAFESYDILKYPKMDGNLVIAIGGIAIPKQAIRVK